MDIMPGVNDPANFSLPRQPLHKYLFLATTMYDTFVSATNPHQFELDGAVYVFDGKPADMKKGELAKRYARREDATEDLATAKEAGTEADAEKCSKRIVKVTKQYNEDCRKLLRLMGVPTTLTILTQTS